MLSKLRSFLVCAVVLPAAAAPLLAETFSNPYRIPTPNDPYTIVVGDINGDGVPDILWYDTSGAAPRMHVLLSQATGGYLPAADLPLPANTGRECFVADFNKDGREDLICAGNYQLSAWVGVFLGNGDGTFQPAVITPLKQSNDGAFSAPLLYVPADLNNDGIPDVMVGDVYSGQAEVLLSDGKGGFGSPNYVAMGINFNPPIVVDLNGDGKPDLFWPVGPLVAFGNGDGTFGQQVRYVNNNYDLATCVLHDMDNDGHLDAVCGYIAAPLGDLTGATGLMILHGNPDGSFNPIPIANKTFGNFDTQYDGFGTFEVPLGVFDLNGDGVPDILGTSGDGLAVLLGGPGLTFSSPQHYAEAWVGNDTISVFATYQSSIADMNGDGIPDIVAAGPNGIYITYGRPDGTFASAAAPEVSEVIGYASVGDFNGDGIPDIAVTGDTAIKVSLGKGDGTFGAPTVLPRGASNIDFSTPLSATNAHILHGDFNGDGKQDLLAIGSSRVYQYDSYVLFGHGDGTFTAPLLVPNSSIVYPMGSSLADAAVYDINRDGRDDIVSMGGGVLSAAQIVFLLSKGDGTFSTVASNVPFDPASNGFDYVNTQPALADFHHDGKLDAVYGALANVYVVRGNGDGSFASSGVTLPIPPTSGFPSLGAIGVAAGDFDGDGNEDFAVLVQYGTGLSPYPSPLATAAWVYYGNGNGTFSAPVLAGAFNRNYTNIAAGDLNRDGLADIVLKTNGSLGDGSAVGVVHSEPSRAFGPEVNYTAGIGLSSLAITDLNGDGFPDMVFGNGGYNTPASSVTVLLNSGKTPEVTGTLVAAPEPSYATQPFSLTARLSSPTIGPGLTGSVAFSVDGAPIGAAELRGNAATLAGPATLAAGAHQLSATWPGDGDFGPVTLSASHTVALVPLQVSLTSAPNASAFGQTVNFATQFAPTGGNPGGDAYTGTLGFYDGATLLRQQQASTAGFGFATQNLSVGDHRITASYSGDAVFAASTSNVVAQVVNALATKSILTVNPTSAIVGAPITLAATVSAAAPPGVGVPTGSVTFKNGVAVVGTSPLANGISSLVLATLPAGADQLTCEYSGDSGYSTSNCNTVPITLNPAATTLTLASSANPAVALAAITFTAHLSTGAQPAAGNTIQLAYNPGRAAPVLVPLVTDATGTATYTTSALTPGSFPVSASFAATADLLASSASLTEIVTANPTATSLAVSPNPGYQGQAVTMVATVAATGGAIATGNVAFLDGAAILGSAALNASGVATLTTTSLSVGTHALAASYAAGPIFLGSTSPPVQEAILASSFTLTLSPASLTLPPGQQGTVAIELASVGMFAGPLTLTYGAPPSYASASVSPSTVTLAAGGAGSSTLVLKTMATASNAFPTAPGPGHWPAILAAVMLLVAPLGAGRGKRWRRFLAIAIAAIALQGLVGCTNHWFGVHVVAPGTYELPVTATDSNQHSQTGTLTIIVTK